MTAGDGYISPVDPVKRLVDHGPDSERWTLVILGDGYRDTELGKYHNDVDALCDQLRTTPPFSQLWCAINIIRIDVVSTDSGADDPFVVGQCENGTGESPRTYFDGKFCSVWQPGVRLEWLLTVDEALARTTAEAHVAAFDQIHVIVNANKYGGSESPDSDVSVSSNEVTGPTIAIHEIGHSFGLADEYGETGSAIAGGNSEPGEPNVTLDATGANGKWMDLVDPSTDLPTCCNKDCGHAGCDDCDPLESSDYVVGRHEGGRYFGCDMYRPYPVCYMNNFGDSQIFCAVCARVIRQELALHMPTDAVKLVESSIHFKDTLKGVITYRAIKFEVHSCAQLTFSASDPACTFVDPAAEPCPFGLPAETAGTVDDPFSPLKVARLWVQLTTTDTLNQANTTIYVTCNETGEMWPVTVAANTTGIDRSAIVLVLDRSGSMAGSAGGGTTKIEKLREAIFSFAWALRGNDGIGLVRFDHEVNRLMNVEVASTGGSASLSSHAFGADEEKLDPRGLTAIGDAIIEGQAALQSETTGPYSTKAMIVLTDGHQNAGTPLADATSTITETTYAIGLGEPSGINTGILQQFTQSTDGYLRITGEPNTSDQLNLLTKFFLQCLAEINHSQVVLDPGGIIQEGDEHRIPFSAAETERSLDVYLLTPDPTQIEFQLETPGGGLITPESARDLGTAEYIAGDRIAIYRLDMPLLEGDDRSSHAGTWNAVLRRNHTGGVAANGNSARGAPKVPLRYDVVVHGGSDLEFSASTTQSSFEPDRTIRLIATLREYSMPVTDRATVWAEVQRPNGTEFNVAMESDGTGEYRGSFRSSAQGNYVVKVRARGQTLEGATFTREQTFTAVAVAGADREDDRQRDPKLDGEQRHFGLFRCVYRFCTYLKARLRQSV